METFFSPDAQTTERPLPRCVLPYNTVPSASAPKHHKHVREKFLVSAQTFFLLMIMQAQGHPGYEVVRNVWTASGQNQERYAEPILVVVQRSEFTFRTALARELVPARL